MYVILIVWLCKNVLQVISPTGKTLKEKKQLLELNVKIYQADCVDKHKATEHHKNCVNQELYFYSLKF